MGEKWFDTLMWSTQGIREWYQGRLGRRVMALLVQEIRDIPELAWAGAERPEVLISPVGLELATPWPTARVVNGLAEAGDECRYDRIVLMHELERSPNVEALMKQCWKLLRPDGRLVVLATNRASPWGVREAFSPLAVGQTYNFRQVEALLREENFTPEVRTYGLYVPPLKWGWLWRWPELWRWSFRRMPWLAGMLVVVARKDVLGMKAMKIGADGKVSLQAVGQPVVAG